MRRCGGCQLRFQQTLLSEGEDSGLNSEYWSDELDLNPASLRELAHMTEEILIIRKLFPEIRPRVLDYGVGKGYWVGLANGFHCEAWGTDIADLCQEYARVRGARWVARDQIPANQFHFIDSDSVFEHIPSPLETLRHLKDALVPGGILKLNLPGRRDYQKTLKAVQSTREPTREQFDAFFLHIEPLIHINLFTPDNIIQMGRKAGLEPYRIPLGLSYASMVLFDSGRQWNRNLRQPWKRWRSRGTWQFFRKPI